MHIQRLQSTDIQYFRKLMNLFAEVFDDLENYQHHIPTDQYVHDFLKEESHIVVVAIDEQENVIGGVVAYELNKFEQQRKELFVYDVGVSANHRRQGVATSLFTELKKIAQQQHAYVIFVQAEEDDNAAIAFYQSIATKALVARHFEIDVTSQN